MSEALFYMLGITTHTIKMKKKTNKTAKRQYFRLIEVLKINLILFISH